MTISIVDITTLTSHGRLFGHFESVAKQYYNILSEIDEAKIMGGRTYLKHFSREQVSLLPFFVTKKDHWNFVTNLKRKSIEVINSFVALKSENDAIIFQCYDEIPIYIALLFCHPKSKVFIIQYQKGLLSKWKRILFNLVNKRISGVITSVEDVASWYGINNVIVPDYFPLNAEFIKKSKLYDIALLGTVTEAKNYLDVVESVKRTNLNVLIAGKFRNSQMLAQLLDSAGVNITIIDRYITNEEYDSFIRESRYVCLPYNDRYEGKSSGVVLDALYRGTPVLTTDIGTFAQVKKFSVGIMYEHSVSEVLSKVQSVAIETELKNNITNYIHMQNKSIERLLNFISK